MRRQGGRAGLGALRDRALRLTCFPGGLRRSELVALDREDVRFAPDGLVLRIRHADCDQEDEGADVGIPRGQAPRDLPGARYGGLAGPRRHRLRSGVPTRHRGRHDRGPADWQRGVEDPAPAGRAGRV
jgi:integrase